MIEQPVLEHGSTRSGRWLRRQRTTIAIAIAVVEAILFVFGAISRPLATVVAVGVIVLYLWLGRRLRPPLADVAWIAAVSQALVALVPVLFFFLATVTIVAIGVLATVSKVLIIVLGLIAIPVYLIWGREQRGTIRHVSWIAAASQALAIVAVLLSHFIGLLVLVLAGVFAAVALFLIFADRG